MTEEPPVIQPLGFYNKKSRGPTVKKPTHFHHGKSDVEKLCELLTKELKRKEETE
jgi:hypothetical protein